MRNNIIGYKSFDENKKNIAGEVMPEGMCYHSTGPIKYGNNGNGFHFCKNLEDTLRYQITGDELVNPPIAKVLGYGQILKSNSLSDEYYGYYDSYVASSIKILKFLTREEILDYATKLNIIQLERFLSQYKLTDEEINLFKGKHIDLDLTILYYQKKIKNVYDLFHSNQKKKVLKLAKKL